MQRTLFAGAVVAAAVVLGSSTASAATLAGRWSSPVGKGTTIYLTLAAHGSSYTGTYSLVSTFTVKKQKKTISSTQPITATYKVANKIPTLVLRFTAHKPPLTSTCYLVKAHLRCVSPATSKVMVFSHVKS
jgi:hypothetical protein